MGEFHGIQLQLVFHNKFWTRFSDLLGGISGNGLLIAVFKATNWTVLEKDILNFQRYNNLAKIYSDHKWH